MAEVLERDPSTLTEVRPASFRANVGSRKFRGVGIGRDGIVLEGSRGLAEQSVVKIDTGDGAGFWAIVSLHEAGQASHRMELRPTLLDEEAEARWAAWRGRFGPAEPASPSRAVEPT